MSQYPKSQALTCPLCQKENNCAVSVGEQIDTCWCKAVVFPPKSSLIEIQPDANACICSNCLDKIKEELTLGLKRVD
ncbi:cysteine-rich CWC family protein [Shewanella sp. VB17]|uniref:cysteine-rich CWC family protein n=1 Tax=Shewanella sp. VB17 TaxID=2739432 RepID=UPI0015638543|nr:cysteine-rich CWC family protein [Shewanella sp. VB17]NRD72360.1 cysteine-rich CWC family protein [Shewanella sp. VB17]